MKCTVCGFAIPAAARACPACASDVGFPNVRFAQGPSETAALEKRLKDAEVSTSARGVRVVLEEFGKSVRQSRAVMARDLGQVHDLVKSDSVLYVSFYKQVRSGARMPEANEWDKGRTAADSTVSPHYFEDLSFAALSLNARGVASFGPYSIVFRDAMIERRSTVFEENPFVFCKRHRITAGQGAPVGYRATWELRDVLARAKLHPRLSGGMKASDFPAILLQNGGLGIEDDFVEVHIYGAIHRSAIESVSGPKPTGGSQLTIWKSVVASLKKLGAQMEVT